jgi:hypothetical protein
MLNGMGQVRLIRVQPQGKQKVQRRDALTKRSLKAGEWPSQRREKGRLVHRTKASPHYKILAQSATYNRWIRA